MEAIRTGCRQGHGTTQQDIGILPDSHLSTAHLLFYKNFSGAESMPKQSFKSFSQKALSHMQVLKVESTDK